MKKENIVVKQLILSPLAFTVAALAVQVSGKDLNLSVLYRHVARVFNSSFDLQSTFEAELLARSELPGKLIFILGSLETPERCHLRPIEGPPIGASYFAEMADSFILGVLALHYRPLVQVAEIRQLVERFWRFPIVKDQFYQHVTALIERGLLVRDGSATDIDLEFVSLPGDAILLEGLLPTR